MYVEACGVIYMYLHHKYAMVALPPPWIFRPSAKARLTLWKRHCCLVTYSMNEVHDKPRLSEIKWDYNVKDGMYRIMHMYPNYNTVLRFFPNWGNCTSTIFNKSTRPSSMCPHVNKSHVPQPLINQTVVPLGHKWGIYGITCKSLFKGPFYSTNHNTSLWRWGRCAGYYCIYIMSRTTKLRWIWMAPQCMLFDQLQQLMHSSRTRPCPIMLQNLPISPVYKYYACLSPTCISLKIVTHKSQSNNSISLNKK